MNTSYLYFLICGAALLFIPIVYIGNIMLKGFFWNYFKVKRSNGALVFVKIRSRLRDYYRPGFIIDNTLRFKDSKNNSRIVTIPREGEVFYRFQGVNCVDVDEEKNAIYRLDASAVSGFDAEKIDDIIQKALIKPGLMTQLLKIILVLVILLLLIIIGSVFFEYKIYAAIKAMQAVAASSITPGV